jgi:hypothetical protein
VQQASRVCRLKCWFFWPTLVARPTTQRSQANIRVTYLHRSHTQVQTLTLLFPNKRRRRLPCNTAPRLHATTVHVGGDYPAAQQQRWRPPAALLLGSTWPRHNGLAGARGSTQQKAHISRPGDDREQRSGDRQADRQRAATQRLLICYPAYVL